MSGTNDDAKIREELNRFVGPMSPGGRWAKIQAEVARRRWRRGFLLRRVLPGLALLVLLAAAVYWAVPFFEEDRVLVIDKTETSQGGGSNGAGEDTSVSESAGWEPVETGPEVKGVYDIPEDMAVKVEYQSDGEGLIRRALVVPASGSYRVEEYPESLAPSVSVLAEDRRYLFIPGDGVVDLPLPEAEGEAQEGAPTIEWAYGPSFMDSVPDDAVWERLGSVYRTRFESAFAEGMAGSEERPKVAQLTVEIERDEQTGIAVREVLSVPDGSSQVRRQVVPVSQVDLPDPDDVRRAAGEYWERQIRSALQAPYEVVGLDLPDLVLKRIRAHSRKVTLDYGLADVVPAAVMIEVWSGTDAEAGKIVENWGEPTYDAGTDLVAFRRGDAVIRIGVTDGSTIGLPENPFVGLDLSLERVRSALVPLDKLPAAGLEPPPAYVEGRRVESSSR